MAYVGMIYNPVPQERERWADPRGRRPAWQARYVAQVRPLAELAEPLRRQGGQVGMDQAQCWVALSDGGSGVEDFLRDNFPRVAAVILDFYHVTEYLGKLAKALYPGREAAAEAWRQEWCHRLKAEGGGPVKFDATIVEALGEHAPRPDALEDLEKRAQRFEPMPADPERLKSYLSSRITS